jgi:hypothetical protein
MLDNYNPATQFGGSGSNFNKIKHTFVCKKFSMVSKIFMEFFTEIF